MVVLIGTSRPHVALWSETPQIPSPAPSPTLPSVHAGAHRLSNYDSLALPTVTRTQSAQAALWLCRGDYRRTTTLRGLHLSSGRMVAHSSIIHHP